MSADEKPAVLIPHWRKAYRLTSVQIAALIAGLSVLAAAWPSFQQYIPPFAYLMVNTILGVAVVVARVIQQPSLGAATASDPGEHSDG